jgi:hypothetical protein
MAMDEWNVSAVINLGIPPTADALIQHICRVGRDLGVEATGYTYVEGSVLKVAVARQSAANVEGKISIKSSSRKDAEVAPSTHNIHVSSLVDPGLQEILIRHAQQKFLVVGINKIFSNLSSVTLNSHTLCLQVKRRLPCSSCMATLPLVTVSPRPTATQPSSSTSDRPQAVMTLAPPAPSLPAKLSKDFFECACQCLDNFSISHWITKSGPRFSWAPPTSYIPYHVQHALLREYHELG